MAKSTGGVGTGVTVGFGVGDCEGVGVAPIMHEGAVVVQPFYIDLHLNRCQFPRIRVQHIPTAEHSSKKIGF